MESNIIIRTEKICRTCMTETSNMRSLFCKLDNMERPLSDVLSFVTNLIIREEDNLPKQICKDCEIIMSQSDSFIRRCVETEARFKMLLHSLNASSSEPEKIVIKCENHLNDLTQVNFSKPYQCSVCIDKFSDVTDLKSHVILVHFKEKTYLEPLISLDTKSQLDDPETKSSIKNNNSFNVKQETEDGEEFPQDDMFTNNFQDNDNELFDSSFDNHIDKCNRKSYSCSMCNLSFETAMDLEDHVKNDHFDIKLVKNECKINENKSKGKIVSTDIFDKVNQDYKCMNCNLNFKSIKCYKNHLKKKHEQNKTSEKCSYNKEEILKKHQCSHCMRKFVKKSTLVAHLKRHDSPSLSHTCSLCKREFIHRAHLDNHVLAVHSTKDGLKCEYCPKSFATQESLDLHKAGHKSKKKHQCKYCSKAFNMLSTLRDHLRVHTGEKPFLCPTCGKGFTQNTNLIEHLRRHQGIKPFKCEMCDRRFVSKGELAAHNRKHSGAHPFVCSDCGNGFTTSSSLVKHRRTHTGERPYACDLCPMKFAASGTLKNHRRTHTGEKPYKCSHCDKAFVQKNDLVAHTRCHTGERPYVCSTCGQAFRQGSALKTHLKMHTVKENQSMLPVRKDVLMHNISHVIPNISQCNSDNV